MTDTQKIALTSLAMTEKFGLALGRTILPGDVVCLDGDLGAGKTTMCQAIARGLEVPQDQYVTSPSFAIMHEYPGRLPVYHMDFYRLHDFTEVIDSGFDEYFYLNGVCLVEWSSIAREVLPENRLEIQLDINGPESRRAICSFSSSWQARIESIARALT